MQVTLLPNTKVMLVPLRQLTPPPPPFSTGLFSWHHRGSPPSSSSLLPGKLWDREDFKPLPRTKNEKGTLRPKVPENKHFFSPDPRARRETFYLFFFQGGPSFFSRSRQYWIPPAVQVCVQKFPVLPLLLLPRLNEIGIFNGNFFALSLSCGKARILCARWIQTSRGFFFVCVCFCPATKKRRETLYVCCMTANACCNRVVWHSDILDGRQDILSPSFAPIRPPLTSFPLLPPHDSPNKC